MAVVKNRVSMFLVSEEPVVLVIDGAWQGVELLLAIDKIKSGVVFGVLRAVKPFIDVLLVFEEEGIRFDLEPTVSLLLELLEDLGELRR